MGLLRHRAFELRLNVAYPLNLRRCKKSEVYRNGFAVSGVVACRLFSVFLARFFYMVDLYVIIRLESLLKFSISEQHYLHHFELHYNSMPLKYYFSDWG